MWLPAESLEPHVLPREIRTTSMGCVLPSIATLPSCSRGLHPCNIGFVLRRE
jgi:hypothetical protein